MLILRINNEGWLPTVKPGFSAGRLARSVVKSSDSEAGLISRFFDISVGHLSTTALYLPITANRSMR